MKENSIEEDIARIAKLITTKFNNDYSIDNRDKEALEHILSDYKRTLKENELAKKQVEYDKTHICTLQIIKLNYIPIQKVKDKIEEEKLPLTIVGGRKNKKTLEYGIKLGRRQILQELIEESEEK
jgi:hypothetical protein